MKEPDPQIRSFRSFQKISQGFGLPSPPWPPTLKNSMVIGYRASLLPQKPMSTLTPLVWKEGHRQCCLLEGSRATSWLGDLGRLVVPRL